jgi:class 3 adenylate cyclase/Flp pilus assembly protein TadD
MSTTDHTEPRQATKLEMAHVLFMDIVGYSKLPMDHQEAVLHTLQEVVSATPQFLQAQASREMIRLPTGDGMAFVFFEDAEAAARCALEVSRALKSHPEVPLRMGLHSGPVYRVTDINASQNVAGGGINIAQRVMDCGDAGHILASQSVADVLGQLSVWKASLHDLGEAEVKHGVRVHLYNLHTDEAGNAALPKKLAAAKAAAEVGSKAAEKSTRLRGKIATAATILFVGLAVGGWLFFSRKAHALSDKDTIVLADFTNTTGDPVFDGTLRQGLSVQLEQSPFLSIVSDQQLQQALEMMGQKPDAKLTPEIARELCQRTGSAAVLDGSIAQIGTRYSLILKAVDCSNGKSLTSTEALASDKNHVLDALGKAASEIRSKLGESLNTVQKFDTPLEQTTTPSLQALQAFHLGVQALAGGDSAMAVPSFRRAIELDPNFAAAYAMLGISYGNLGESSLMAENTRKAFELREHVSEFEKLGIESFYYVHYTGDLEKARQASELWERTYPREGFPRNALNAVYWNLGQFDNALVESHEALRLDPQDALMYANVVESYLNLSLLAEARATADEAKARNLDSPALRVLLYSLAFLQNDVAAMEQLVAWATGKPGVEDVLLASEADTAAYSGKLAKSREFSRQAVASAERAEEKEVAASYEAEAAIREALFGNAAEAQRRAAAALDFTNGPQVEFGAALSLAFAGDVARAQTLANDLDKRFPEDTIVQFNYLPTIRARLALNRNDSSKAVHALQTAAPYELGLAGGLYPVYVRGEAYLAAHQGSEAAAEFQKILDHRGIVLNEPIGALAHLGLARAYTTQRDTAKAKAAYQDFLTLWKDADSDIPVFIAAKSEYAKLK